MGSKLWTEERLGPVRELAARRFSSGEIAKRVGVTRNAIIGICRRAGIPLEHPQYSLKNKPPPPRRGPRRDRKIPGNFLSHPVIVPPPPPSKVGPLGIMELENQHCRWLVTDKAPWVYCGAPEANVTGGMPYCKNHARMSYNRPARFAVAEQSQVR